MNKQDRLLDYLYGEMNPAEKADFEKMLADDPALRAELTALQQTRHQLSELADLRPETTVVALPAGQITWRKWAVRAAVAAGFLLLLSLFNARLQWNADGLVFSLGQPAPAASVREPVETATLAQADLQPLFAQQETKLNRQLQARDSLWQQQLLSRDQQLQAQWENRLASYRAGERAEMKQFVAQLQEENLPELAALLQSMQLEQQQEIQAMLTDLWYEWQHTRAADLRSIETEFVNLYQNTERNQLETEALLRNILTDRNL